MKLALATFATALVLATSASAMIGPYERETDAKLADGELVSGSQTTVQVSTIPSGPSIDWAADGKKSVTIFKSSKTNTQSGFEGR